MNFNNVMFFIFILEKPGKSKFAPSIGGRKTTTTAPVAKDVSLETISTEQPTEPQTLLEASEKSVQENSSVREVPETDSSSSTVGKKIESIQSRRMAASAPVQTPSKDEHLHQSNQIKLPTGPKDAASIATTTGTNLTEKRTMAYFLKDSGEGREMPAASGNNSDPSLSPSSKTRRIVNLRNIKAPPRSATTSTAMAPQVRVVDGAIVYDEKFSAAISMPPTSSSTAELEQELEYIDEDDENGKHLTSATYSTKAKGSNRWNPSETDLFYEALSMCGTDFSMIQTLIPHRTRAQIKGKYKLEEKANLARVNGALRSRKPFDPTFKDRVQEFTNNQNKK